MTSFPILSRWASSRRRRSSDAVGDDFDEDDPTIIDGAQFLDEITPTEPALCVECGGIVFFDSVASASFPDDRCLRTMDQHWHWCAKLRKSVTYVPA
jgi:hypothetical protein